MGNTAKGAPYPDGSDAPDGPTQIQALAEWVDARPGVSIFTYAAIGALAGADLWEGRTVWQNNTGTDRPHEGIYVFNGVDWTPPWNVAWGLVESGRVVDTGGPHTYSDNAEHVLAPAVGPIVLRANRKYRVDFEAIVRNEHASIAGITLRIKDGTTLIEQARVYALPPGSDAPVKFSVRPGSITGSHTIHATVQASTADGVSVGASGSPLVMEVHDDGALGTP